MNKIHSNLNKYFLFIILKILSIILVLYGLLLCLVISQVLQAFYFDSIF